MNEFDKRAIIEVVKKISGIENGDIFIVRCDDFEAMQQFGEAIFNMYGVQTIIIDEANIDVLRSIDEREMKELGWQKIK